MAHPQKFLISNHLVQEFSHLVVLAFSRGFQTTLITRSVNSRHHLTSRSVPDSGFAPMTVIATGGLVIGTGGMAMRVRRTSVERPGGNAGENFFTSLVLSL